MSEIKIRCPHCSWEPDGGAHWACTCDHVWNTFDTAGVCPSCNKKWEDTSVHCQIVKNGQSMKIGILFQLIWMHCL